MQRLDGVGSLGFKNLRTNDIVESYCSLCCSNLCSIVVVIAAEIIAVIFAPTSEGSDLTEKLVPRLSRKICLPPRCTVRAQDVLTYIPNY
jgi:hypothetical protein